MRRYYLRDKPNGTDNDGKQDSEFDEACPTEAADLLGRSRLLLDIIGFVRCVCLDKGRCVDILIHDKCIHIGAFNSSRAITRCSNAPKASVCKTLGVWSGAFILALDTTKAPDGAISSHVLTAYRWQTIGLYEQNDCTCQFGVEFLIIGTCGEVVREFVLRKYRLNCLIVQQNWC